MGTGGTCIRCPDSSDTCDLRSASMELDATSSAERVQIRNHHLRSCPRPWFVSSTRTLNPDSQPLPRSWDASLDFLIRLRSISESPCAGCRVHAGAVPYHQDITPIGCKGDDINTIENTSCLVWETTSRSNEKAGNQPPCEKHGSI